MSPENELLFEAFKAGFRFRDTEYAKELDARNGGVVDVEAIRVVIQGCKDMAEYYDKKGEDVLARNERKTGSALARAIGDER